jgi:hypothetical protein
LTLIWETYASFYDNLYLYKLFRFHETQDDTGICMNLECSYNLRLNGICCLIPWNIRRCLGKKSAFKSFDLGWHLSEKSISYFKQSCRLESWTWVGIFVIWLVNQMNNLWIGLEQNYWCLDLDLQEIIFQSCYDNMTISKLLLYINIIILIYNCCMNCTE